MCRGQVQVRQLAVFVESAFPGRGLDALVGQQIVQIGARLQSEVGIERAAGFLPRVEQHRAVDHHARGGAAGRRLGLLLGHQRPAETIAKRAFGQKVIAPGCRRTRRLVQLPRLDKID